ncbi:CRS2-associated factor 1 [Pyrus ussuriensis x Pyrus communis]|uniref:CRS2-associated factor 1 n=1 Tax=Pyrus ussuriensis x Pyrus communis TaxID=2448454 RepID=A0A5N5GBP1_9ROSA|nr:CRS2-associated factor 1 [Pyrus ussuriensis x Pyrus communis]
MQSRNYNPKKRPVILLTLWKPHEPVYPKLIKTTIDGLSIAKTKEMRKRGLAVLALTKLGSCSCIPLTFEKEQIVVWRGKDYKPPEDGYFLPDRELFDSPEGDLGSGAEACDKSESDGNSSLKELSSGEDE